MSSLTQFARACAAERAATVNQERERVLNSPSEDAVHDFRVALRRMEQIFDLFDIEPLAFDVSLAQTQMKAWMRAAGRVRDCDVVMPLLQAPWTNDLIAYRKERARDMVDVVAASASMPAPHVPHKVRVTAEVVQFAGIILPRETKVYFKAGFQAAREKQSLGQLHDFRLHGKSLRYSLELFEQLYGPRVAGLQRTLKRTQLVLGEMADARAALKLLKQMNAPRTVLERVRELAEEKRKAFAGSWTEEVAHADVAANWVEYLRRYAAVRP